MRRSAVTTPWTYCAAWRSRGALPKIALYTGNDDHIILDLITTFRGLRMVGGLLGQRAVWTRRAVAMLEAIHREPNAPEWLEAAARLTDANGTIFDVANGFRGSIPGVHEVLRRQGLLDGIWCLDPDEDFPPANPKRSIESARRIRS